jgi:Rod binding domain-containing protein
MSTIDTSNLPPINPALEPASVRNGNQAAKNAYETGLAFEQVLVDQLSQQLAATAGGSSDGSSSDGSSDTSSSSSGGLMGSDPASSMYSQMLPQALSTSVMSAGGLGLAAQLAGAIDPAIKATK